MRPAKGRRMMQDVSVMDNSEHIPYEKVRNRLPDFVVEYSWDPEEIVKTQKRFQGIRSDFLYEGDDPSKDGIFMIWPEFLDAEGNVITRKDSQVEPTGHANMWICFEEMIPYHKERLKVGTKGYMVAGSKKLANLKVLSTNFE